MGVSRDTTAKKNNGGKIDNTDIDVRIAVFRRTY